MFVAPNLDRQFAFNDKQNTLSGSIKFRSLATTARLHFHDILRESLGKAGEGTRNHPSAGLFPKGQVARYYIAKSTFGDDRIGLRKYRPVCQQLRLRRQAASRGVIFSAHIECP